MPDKIIIGASKKRDKKDTGQATREKYYHRAEAEPVEQNVVPVEQDTVTIPLDDNVWGNDHSIISRLDEKQLADRRLFVRVRHIQRIECNTVYDDIDSEPALLSQPIVLFISDISMGGIGIISEQEISTGKILDIQLSLDTIPYEVKCEVVYCFRNENKYRAGLRIVQKDKQFIKHLKIFVARISLTNTYGQAQNSTSQVNWRFHGKK